MANMQAKNPWERALMANFRPYYLSFLLLFKSSYFWINDSDHTVQLKLFTTDSPTDMEALRITVAHSTLYQI